MILSITDWSSLRIHEAALTEVIRRLKHLIVSSLSLTSSFTVSFPTIQVMKIRIFFLSYKDSNETMSCVYSKRDFEKFDWGWTRLMLISGCSSIFCIKFFGFDFAFFFFLGATDQFNETSQSFIENE